MASVALGNRLIDQRLFVALVVMALLTSMMSRPMIQWLLKKAGPFFGIITVAGQEMCNVPDF